MQFNSANKNNRNNSRPGFRQNSSDSRSYSKKPNFRQGKPFGSDDNNDDQPRRNSNNSGEKRGYNRYGKNENGNSRFDSGKSFKSGSRSTSQRHASDNNAQGKTDSEASFKKNLKPDIIKKGITRAATNRMTTTNRISKMTTAYVSTAILPTPACAAAAMRSNTLPQE